MLSSAIGRGVLVAVGVATFPRPVLAHAGSLGGSLETASAPFWLVLVSGGGVVGVSFLFTSLMTDHDLIRSVNARRTSVSSVSRGASPRWVAVRWFAVVALLAVIILAFVAPASPTANTAVLFVWVGWWAGYTMSVYLVADTWSTVNPWRTLGDVLSTRSRSLPARVGVWPSVVGLLGLVWVEVVSPVAGAPRLLGAIIVLYSVVTLAGAATFGQAWFQRVDPVTRVFTVYGQLAPLQRTDQGLSLSVPGSKLVRHPTAMKTDEVAFVIALLWVTTYDGLVSTVGWNELVGGVVDAGVPPRLFHLVTILAGFGLFFGTYRLAAKAARQTADSYVTREFIEGWFTPALVPIAAGYHLAHFLGYFLTLAPTLVTVALDPLSPPVLVPVMALPSWFGSLQLAFVVLGHLLAIWVAHARSFDLFPGRLQPIRSQYPFILVMVVYTMTSLWVVAQPYAPPLT
ncbi:MAG: hypothetical protein ACQETI_12205 [Halobacteriota archaeon]